MEDHSEVGAGEDGGARVTTEETLCTFKRTTHYEDSGNLSCPQPPQGREKPTAAVRRRKRRDGRDPVEGRKEDEGRVYTYVRTCMQKGLPV